jgi:SSS family solute:Na+ symporter
MLGIGFYTNKKSIKTSLDYLVAGRRLPWWLLVGTLAATEIGAGSTMGVTQKAYGQWGLSSIWYIWTMSISFIAIAIVAPRLRSSEVLTVPEFFLKKYGRINHILTSIIMFLPLIGLTAVQMIATATIFSAVTGIDYRISALISCGVIVTYTVLGGMWSVSITDFWQFILILIGMGLAMPFVIIKAGGFTEIIAHVPPEKLSLFEGMGIGKIISLIIIYVSSWLIGQEVTQRLYSAKDKASVIKGSTVTAVFYFFFAFIPPLLGISIYALEHKGVIPSTIINNFSDMYVLPVLAMNVLPVIIAGLLFAGLISATMSSASSDLLGAASIITNDLWFQYIKKNEADDRKKILIIRILAALIGVLSLAIAILKPEDIIKILMFSFSLRAAGCFIPYIAGHYWAKITPLSTFLSLSCASILLVILELTNTTIFGLEPIIPSLAVSAIIIVFFSLKPFQKASL